MIKKEIVDAVSKNRHIIVYTNEPARFEIIGDFVIHGYKGIKTNMEQEPCLFHDTDLED